VTLLKTNSGNTGTTANLLFLMEDKDYPVPEWFVPDTVLPGIRSALYVPISGYFRMSDVKKGWIVRPECLNQY
jgi:hypothetical protein